MKNGKAETDKHSEVHLLLHVTPQQDQFTLKFKIVQLNLSLEWNMKVE
jgi:hypothetical protein